MARKHAAAMKTPSTLFLTRNLRSWLSSGLSPAKYRSRMQPLSACGRLFCQFRAECLLALGNITLVAIGIDERVRPALFHSGVFRLHAVVISMRAKKNVARQGFQDAEHALVV